MFTFHISHAYKSAGLSRVLNKLSLGFNVYTFEFDITFDFYVFI